MIDNIFSDVHAKYEVQIQTNIHILVQRKWILAVQNNY